MVTGLGGRTPGDADPAVSTETLEPPLGEMFGVDAAEFAEVVAPPRPAAKVAEPRVRYVSPAPFGRRFWRDLSIGATLVVLLHVFILQISVVRGLSMAPSLQDGDRLMVDRVSYSMTDVSRFDVVVLRYPRNHDVDFVKRVIGLPGDRVELHDGTVTVNGREVPEDFAHFVDLHAEGEWTVPQDKFFVLGDNRPISCDSREFGMVDRGLIKGKVRVRFWPLDRFSIF